jgi:uncharacterized repeat protein (TIGR02543 family)
VQSLCEIVAIAAGYNYTVALKHNGSVWVWGENSNGELGNATNAYFSSVPAQLTNLSNIAAIAAGDFHTVALTKDGTVWSWGNNNSGRLGYDTGGSSDRTPRQVSTLNIDGVGVKAIAAGGGHTAALKNDGTVWTWGSNYYGQLGYNTGTVDYSITPNRVPNLSDIDSIALGNAHTAVLKKNDRTVWEWGYNSRDPVQVRLNSAEVLKGVVSIVARDNRTIALLEDGSLRGWGANDYGQLGDGTFEKNRQFATKPILNGVFNSVGTGTRHSIAVKNDGTIWTWGYNDIYQLGYQTPLAQMPNAPSNVPYPVGGFSVTSINPTLAIIGRLRLSYPEWSTAPMNLTVNLINPGSELTKVTLKLIPGSGLSLVNDEAVHVIDKIAAGRSATTTWKVKPAIEGTHQLNVNAYREGETVPFVTTSFQIEALAPVVPPNVTLGGTIGYNPNGTPVAARSAILMFNLNHSIPCQNVKLIATDAAGHRYVIDNKFTSAVSFIFIPSRVGLTVSPVTIEIVAECLDPIRFPIELIDPSGIVYNAARGDEKVWPLPGATVGLQYYDPATSLWIEMSEDAFPGKMSPITNPQITGEDGRFAWDTARGQYRVIVSRPGFQSATSRIVTVPPPVTDLHVGLTPLDMVPPGLTVTGVTYGATYTQPVTIQFQASDNESGVRYVTYQLDQGNVQLANGNNGSFLVAAPGSHKVDFTVADHAGNEFVKKITFTIAESPPGNTTYTVVFNSNGGSPVSSETVSNGSKATKPSDPVRAGYVFGGWYSDSGLTSSFDFATSITRDTNLYAKWTSISNADLSALIVTSSILSPAFATGTTSYTASVASGVSSVTVTASVYNATYTSVTASVYNDAGTLMSGPFSLKSGAASPPLMLSVGSNKIKVVVTALDGITKTYTVTVTRSAQSSGDGSDSSSSPGSYGGGMGSVSNNTTRLRILIDGKEFEQIATAAASQEDGRTMLTVTLDTAQLTEQLAKARDNPVIVIPVAASSDKVILVLSGDAVKALENKKAILEMRTPNGSYKLPAAEIRIDSLSTQLGGLMKLPDITVQTVIAKSDSTKVKLMENAAAKGHFTVVVPPVDFTVTASYDGKTVILDKFKSYVQREIPLPAGVEPSRITTAVVLEADGTTRQAPTYVTLRDGKYYAVVNSLTNSTYSLIWHPMTFADVEGHWAKHAVNDMASRMVVNGVDENRYQPDAAITRAEFTAIIVRALGLANNVKAVAFTDVKSSDWYVGAVAKAQEYGILEGYEDQTFRPTKTISRQEAIVMIARAMKFTELETNISTVNADAVLSKFSDGRAVHVWAKQAVASVISNGLVSGSNEGLMPTSNITRAETAAIVERMLEKAKLIGSSF